MSVKLVQHIPAFVDTDKVRVVEAETLADLLADSWPQQWANDKGFHRFSVSQDYPGGPRMLMAEQNGGRKWWVVGFLSGDEVDLPKWEPVR